MNFAIEFEMKDGEATGWEHAINSAADARKAELNSNAHSNSNDVIEIVDIMQHLCGAERIKQNWHRRLLRSDSALVHSDSVGAAVVMLFDDLIVVAEQQSVTSKYTYALLHHYDLDLEPMLFIPLGPRPLSTPKLLHFALCTCICTCIYT